MFQRLCLIALLFSLTAPASPLYAQRGGRGGTIGSGEKPATTKPGEPKKYDDVITKDAKTTPGIFTVHRIDDKIYFEIPKEGFDRLMLWQTEVVKGPAGITWGGYSIGRNYIRWDRRGNKVYLWQVSFAKRGDGKAIQSAVDSANLDTIILSFNVEAEGKDRSTVIDATPLYLSDVADLSVKSAVGAFGAGAGSTAIDASRSYVDEVKAFPTNIEVRSLLTFRGGGAGGGLGRGGRGAIVPDAAHGPQSYSAGPLQHGRPAGKADDGPILRSARRLLHAAI